MNWLIYESKSGLWWRPNAEGYTGNLAEAGFYSEEQAKKRAANPSRKDLAIPLDHFADGIKRLYGALFTNQQQPDPYAALSATWREQAIAGRLLAEMVKDKPRAYEMQLAASALVDRLADELDALRAAARPTDLEPIGLLIDKTENYLQATMMPISAAIHLKGLRHGLREIRDELRKFYFANGGEDVWK